MLHCDQDFSCIKDLNLCTCTSQQQSYQLLGAIITETVPTELIHVVAFLYQSNRITTSATQCKRRVTSVAITSTLSCWSKRPNPSLKQYCGRSLPFFRYHFLGSKAVDGLCRLQSPSCDPFAEPIDVLRVVALSSSPHYGTLRCLPPRDRIHLEDIWYLHSLVVLSRF